MGNKQERGRGLMNDINLSIYETALLYQEGNVFLRDCLAGCESSVREGNESKSGVFLFCFWFPFCGIRPEVRQMFCPA